MISPSYNIHYPHIGDVVYIIDNKRNTQVIAVIVKGYGMNGPEHYCKAVFAKTVSVIQGDPILDVGENRKRYGTGFYLDDNALKSKSVYDLSKTYPCTLSYVTCNSKSTVSIIEVPCEDGECPLFSYETDKAYRYTTIACKSLNFVYALHNDCGAGLKGATTETNVRRACALAQAKYLEGNTCVKHEEVL